jgi:hypothetical protein
MNIYEPSEAWAEIETRKETEKRKLGEKNERRCICYEGNSEKCFALRDN